MTTKYLTPKEAATVLEVSPASVVRWVREGLIPAMRIGHRTIKIPRTAIEQIVNQNQEERMK
jgi:excisionase family DNA binding protein